MRAAVSAFQDQDVGLGHERVGQAAGLSQLDVARIEHRCAVVLEVQLRRAEHVSSRMESHGGGTTPHRLSVAEHPPAARPPRLRDQGERLRRQQRLLVAPGVVGVGV